MSEFQMPSMGTMENLPVDSYTDTGANMGSSKTGNERFGGHNDYDKPDREKRSKSRDKDKDRSSSRRKRDRSRDRDREKDKDKERDRRDRDRDRDRDRERDRDRDRERDRDYRRSSHRSSRDRDRSSRDRERSSRERSSRRDRDRDSRARRSNSRNYEDYESRRRRDRSRDRRRSRSRSYDRKRNSRTRDRSMSRERSERMHLESIKEEVTRDNRFDLTQTIQELMSSTANAKNFAALFNSNNSNDSLSNGATEHSQEETERKRRKKSRWGGTENDKTFIPGMPTILPPTLDPKQQEAYLVQLQIEEISRKLRTGDLGIPQNPEERSPSPEPIYSSDGKRLNTREFRYRKKLEDQRHQLIQKMQTVNPDFKPPADYKPPVTRVIDKVLIPQEQHPDINFVGLLIGPRGNTLKAMEKETGAKIIIRGKGSVKEGKVGRKDGQPLAGEDEPLHAFITASNPEAVKKAVDKIKDIIRQGIEVPEGHNDLRRMQLRELAQLNGTLRETDCPRCTNCGSTEHKSWLCPDKPNVTNSIVCTACGGAGHISKDCRSKRPGAGMPGEEGENSQAKIDEEYMSLMAELGEGPPPSAAKPQPDPLAQVHINRGYSIFDKKPVSMPAIQNTQPTHSPMNAVAPPPPMPPPWGSSNAPPVGMPPLIPPPPTTQPPTPVSMPPLIPPPPTTQPPTPAAPPPLMPWMSVGAPQPPPPGGDPPPPGTGPMPPLLPPPTGLPHWQAPPGLLPPGFPGWGGPGSGAYAPPPPPPCAPPPGIGSLAQPPPPPPS
ncbi:splicing factor 1 [Haematobia irritans]|uniref:splicing factor 1 n=1 Tax=Haematobia irritans TaxID=7368 RepID=UPI003F50BD9F